MRRTIGPVDADTAARLTDRQRAVLRLTADGHGLREIAQELGTSTHTARHHRDAAVRRLGARSLPHAVALLVRAEPG
jgi:DNA-binding CsgD family transcriptional regulator